MKILVLAQSRSGSTSLIDYIIKATNIEYLHEPFNIGDSDDFSLQLNKIKNSTDLIVKIVDNHFYKMTEFKYYKDLTKCFDKVVGLTRIDDYANARSRWIAEHFNSWEFSSKSFNFDEKTLNKERLNELIHESKHNRKLIQEFDIFQATYEGLFIDNTEWSYLDSYLNISKKK